MRERQPEYLLFPVMGHRGEELLELIGCRSPASRPAWQEPLPPQRSPRYLPRHGARQHLLPRTPSSGTRHGSKAAGKPPRQGAGLGLGRSNGAPAVGWGSTCGVRAAPTWAPSLAKAGDAGGAEHGTPHRPSSSCANPRRCASLGDIIRLRKAPC